MAIDTRHSSRRQGTFLLLTWQCLNILPANRARTEPVSSVYLLAVLSFPPQSNSFFHFAVLSFFLVDLCCVPVYCGCNRGTAAAACPADSFGIEQQIINGLCGEHRLDKMLDASSSQRLRGSWSLSLSC